ncbi:ester cyclase [Mesorhizobium sp. M1272]|uniref:ester cyclase n=1 Tax=Mesorhizobium sp. M1272 TaxID=2957074 RepID=UPI00333B9225
MIPAIFHEGFTFRGSLGPVLVGHSGFADYVRWVTSSLDHYTSDILEMIEEGNRVSAKLRFHGIHRRPLFGRAPTGRHVWWYGMPIFTFEDGKVRDLWVLGDIHGLISRIDGIAHEQPEFRAASTGADPSTASSNPGIDEDAPAHRLWSNCRSAGTTARNGAGGHAFAICPTHPAVFHA